MAHFYDGWNQGDRSTPVFGGSCSGDSRYVVLGGAARYDPASRSSLGVIYIGRSQDLAATAMECCIKQDLEHAHLYLVIPDQQVYVIERATRQASGRYSNDFPINEKCSESFSELMYQVLRHEDTYNRGNALVVAFDTIPGS